MSFQFLCPQGHLLQGEPSQMGQTINCPTCGILFVVPTVVSSGAQTVASVPPAAPPHSQTEGEFPNLHFRKRADRRFAHLDEPASDEPFGAAAAEEAIPDFASSIHTAFDPVDSGPRLVHIDCPQGHELITPLDTMGQDVLCPHCGEQFTMRYENTREYKTEQHWKEEVRQQKLGKQWLIWAVVVGVLVLLMFVGMMIYTGTK